MFFFFFSSRRRHTRFDCDWSSDVCSSDLLDVADNKIADPHDGTVAYVPPLERTAGQPEPFAAHGGLSYMAFARDGDAGTAVALEDALAEIASGESQRV